VLVNNWRYTSKISDCVVANELERKNGLGPYCGHGDGNSSLKIQKLHLLAVGRALDARPMMREIRALGGWGRGRGK